MKSLEKKYHELKKTCENHERIFQDVGVPNTHSGEGFYRDPIRDTDGTPRLEKFYVNPDKAASRLHDLSVNGWREYLPAPADVKKAK